MMLCPRAARERYGITAPMPLLLDAYSAACGPNAATAIAYSSQRRGAIRADQFYRRRCSRPGCRARAGTDTGRRSADLARSASGHSSSATHARAGAKRPAGGRAAGANHGCCQTNAGAGENAPRNRQGSFNARGSFGRRRSALSADPVFDEGTYQRIKEALLSYSAIQVRGGWPVLPADAKLSPGARGPAVALLRQRLVISETCGRAGSRAML